MARTLRSATAAVAAASLLLAGPSAAQEDDASPERVQALLSRALDDLAAASRALRDEPSEAERAAAGERLGAAVERYAEALDLLPRVDLSPAQRAQVQRLAHYNTACARSLQGRAEEALDAFGRALEAGYADFDRIERDPDLDPLRDEPRYARLLERARGRLARETREAAEEAVSDEALFPFDFEVTTLEGETLRLEDLRGKVVIVDFWGTRSNPCRAEVPHLVTLADELGDRLAVVGMTWEKGDRGPQAEARVRRVAADLGVDYPLVMADRDLLKRVPELDAPPTTTLFIDARGRVRAREEGYRDLEVLRSLVEALAAEDAPAEDEGERERAF